MDPNPKDISYIRFGDHVPEGMVLMTLDEVERFQKKKLRDWKKKWQIWPLVYIPHIQVLPITATCYGFAMHYRKSLGIPVTQAFFSTFASPLITTACISTLYYDLHLRPQVLTRDYTCKMCLATRVGVIQCLISAAHNHLCTFSMCALKGDKGQLPSIFDWRAVLKFLQDKSPSRNIVLPVYLGHFIMGTFFTSAMIDNFENVFSKPEQSYSENSSDLRFE